MPEAEHYHYRRDGSASVQTLIRLHGHAVGRSRPLAALCTGRTAEKMSDPVNVKKTGARYLWTLKNETKMGCACACVCGALPGARDGVEPRREAQQPLQQAARARPIEPRSHTNRSVTFWECARGHAVLPKTRTVCEK